ncbi:hypothetical protein [Acetobacter indonesiensis]|nr:hypothetical protein [Acetobacter indonesiensis]
MTQAAEHGGPLNKREHCCPNTRTLCFPSVTASTFMTVDFLFEMPQSAA